MTFLQKESSINERHSCLLRFMKLSKKGGYIKGKSIGQVFVRTISIDIDNSHQHLKAAG